MSYILGITGTRMGMTAKQKSVYVHLLGEHGMPYSLHHGDCVGVDSEAHTIASNVFGRGMGGVHICVHPPIKDDLRANCSGDSSFEPTNYLARNRNIVKVCDKLFAFPLMQEETKGGTWYTINYARKSNKEIYIVWPDGTVTHEKPKGDNSLEVFM